MAGHMYSLTNETLKHGLVLVQEFCPKLTASRSLICCCNIDVEDCCLHKRVELDQGLLVGQVEHVVWLEQFIKSTQWAGGLAGDELFVKDDVEGVNPLLGSANSEDVWLFTISSPQVFINAAAWLKNRTKKWS